MTCEEALLLLSGHLDHANTPEEEAQLRRHLETCEECRQLLEAFRKNDEALKAVEAEPPAALKDDIMAAIRQEAGPKKNAHRRAWAAVAVAAALTVVVGTGIWKQSIPAEQPAAETESMAMAEKSRGISACDVEEAAVETRGVEGDPDEIALFAAPMMADSQVEAQGQILADQYGATVAVLHDLSAADIPELAAVCVPAQSVDEGMLYILGSADAAETLCAEYGGELFLPMTDLEKSMEIPQTELEKTDVSYVLLSAH